MRTVLMALAVLLTPIICCLFPVPLFPFSVAGAVDQELFEALKQDNAAMVVQLLAKGSDVAARDVHGNTALLAAAVRGQALIIDILLHHGANVNFRNHDGVTPLMAAAAFGNAEIVKKLAARGASLEMRNKNGSTPLTFAVEQGRTVTIQVLLDLGADLHAKDDAGATILGKSVFLGRTAAMRLLLSRGGLAVHAARNLVEVVAGFGDGQGQGGDNLRVLRDAMARLEPWLWPLAEG